MDNFRFKHFSVKQHPEVFKVGTDGVLLGAWANVSNMDTAIDIGTGTGLIPLMIAQRNPTTIIHGIDINPKACELAEENAKHSPWSNRITISNYSLEEYVKTNTPQAQLVTSNPPFFVNSTKSHDSIRNTSRHTDSLPYSQLLELSGRLLVKNGRLAIIIPIEEEINFIRLAENFGLCCSQKVIIYPKPGKKAKRIMLEFINGERNLITSKSSLVIEGNSRAEFSAEYKKLTRDFYLAF